MFDFSNMHSNLEGASLWNIISIALIAFVLSSLIAVTFEKTSQDIDRPRFFIQSLILIAIPVATVMQAIGDSLARGLGMLGALAIIRFRTTLRSPRNMVFMFASIGVGIAAGVYGLLIALIGTIGFCLTVFILHYSPLTKNEYVIGYLQFQFPTDASETLENELSLTLEQYCSMSVLLNYRIHDKKSKDNQKGIPSFEYKIRIQDRIKATSLVNILTEKLGVLNVTLNFKEDYEKI